VLAAPVGGVPWVASHWCRSSHWSNTSGCPAEWLSGGPRILHAIDDVSLEIYPGEVLGLVASPAVARQRWAAASCGWSSRQRQIIFDGQDLVALGGDALRHLRQEMQIVFQSPLSSLSPRFKVFMWLQSHCGLIRGSDAKNWRRAS